MKRIIYTQENGIVAITTPMEADYIEWFIANRLPAGVDYAIVPIEAQPTDRTFRNAWVKDNAAIKTDIPKAKLIAHDKRRAKRAAELAPLDIEATLPAKANQAEAARQAIRDKHATLQTNINDVPENIDWKISEAQLKQLLTSAGAL